MDTSGGLAFGHDVRHGIGCATRPPHSHRLHPPAEIWGSQFLLGEKVRQSTEVFEAVNSLKLLPTDRVAGKPATLQVCNVYHDRGTS